MRGAHETADVLPVPAAAPEVLEPHPEGLAAQRHADELAVDALGRDPSERILADEVGVELDQALHAGHVERRVLHRHVVAVVEDPGLEPPLVARGDRADPRWSSRLHHAVPELGAARAVAQVDLVADLTRPPRARDDHRARTQVAFRTAPGSRTCSWAPGPGAARRPVRGS